MKRKSKDKSITIVVPSRQNGEESEEFINSIKNTVGCTANVIFVVNDKGVGLSELYSKMLTSDQITTDIVVFCHDDIEFLKDGWGEELIKLFDKNRNYGIIGVAGSAEFDSMGAWWNYKKKYGQVLHKHDGKSWLTAFSPLLDKDLEEVCVIDGLFIAVKKSRISKNFDPDVSGFNFYDIDFCLANFLDGKTKIGVTTNIRLAHKSIGELSKNWYDNREFINKKYGEYYPIKV
jgi:hypothetical protein